MPEYFVTCWVLCTVVVQPCSTVIGHDSFCTVKNVRHNVLFFFIIKIIFRGKLFAL